MRKFSAIAMGDRNIKMTDENAPKHNYQDVGGYYYQDGQEKDNE